MNNKIILIVGESGSGKDTIVDRLCKEYGYKKLISYTTRPQRNDAKDVNSHIFVTDEEFDKLENMVAFTEFNGYRYCCTSSQVDESDIYIIDCEGIKYFKQHYKGEKDVITIYISVPKVDRFLRMEKRDGTVKAMERIKHDEVAFEGVTEMSDIILHNPNIESIPSVVKTIDGIIKGDVVL